MKVQSWLICPSKIVKCSFLLHNYGNQFKHSLTKCFNNFMTFEQTVASICRQRSVTLWLATAFKNQCFGILISSFTQSLKLKNYISWLTHVLFWAFLKKVNTEKWLLFINGYFHLFAFYEKSIECIITLFCFSATKRE